MMCGIGPAIAVAPINAGAIFFRFAHSKLLIRWSIA
jgi:hypothetical protein